jgi:hypothetical protein
LEKKVDGCYAGEKIVHEQEEVVDEPLMKEEIHVERVPTKQAGNPGE